MQCNRDLHTVVKCRSNIRGGVRPRRRSRGRSGDGIYVDEDDACNLRNSTSGEACSRAFPSARKDAKGVGEEGRGAREGSGPFTVAGVVNSALVARNAAPFAILNHSRRYRRSRRR
jgi:hypothetical protein